MPRKMRTLSSAVERPPYKREVVGATPTESTTAKKGREVREDGEQRP